MRFIADAAMGVIVFTAMRGGTIDQERIAEDLASMGGGVYTMHSVDCTKATSLDDREVCEKYGK